MLKLYARIYTILPASSRGSFVMICAMSAFVGLAETVGVLSVLPFVAAAADPDILSNSGWITNMAEKLGLATHRTVLLALGILSFFALCGAIAFRAAALVAQTRFARGLTADFSTLLMGRYLGQDYAWFLGRHSSDLNKSVLSEVEQVVENAVMTGIRLLSLAAVSGCLILVLFFANPGVTLTLAAMIGGSYGLVFYVMRRKLTRLGAERVTANKERFQVVQEAMGGIKAVKLHHLEDWFLERYSQKAARMSDIRTRIKLMSDLPSYGLEAVIFGGMILFVLWILVSSDATLLDALPMMSLFAVAGIRLFPVLQQLFVAFATLRAHAPALEAMYCDITRLRGPVSQADAPPLRLRHGVDMRGLSFTHSGAPTPALIDVSLSVCAGEIVGLAGHTGAGKSTLVDVMLGLLPMQTGEISVDGYPVTPENLRAWQRVVGYVPQSIHLADDTLAANIAFGIAPQERDPVRLKNALQAASLVDVVATLPKGVETYVGEMGLRLSGGQRQRVGIARALYRQPDFLVLDEATSALDTATETEVLDQLKAHAGDTAVLMVAHRLTSLQRCDRIFVLADGRKIAEGTFAELSANDAAFRALHKL